MIKKLLPLLFSLFALTGNAADNFNILDKSLYPTTFGTSGQCWISGGSGVAPNWGSCLTGAGSVTSVSVTTANGVSGTVATATTTPAISLTLGAITPSSVSTGALTSSALTSGRVPFATTAGLLTDAATLTFSAGTLTSTAYIGSLAGATGLPISTGVAGLGTGVATALAVNVGSAGAPVVFGGALGTPSSGNGSNITNVNAATLGGATFAAPGAIGGGTPGSVSATTITSTARLNAGSTVNNWNTNTAFDAKGLSGITSTETVAGIWHPAASGSNRFIGFAYDAGETVLGYLSLDRTSSALNWGTNLTVTGTLGVTDYISGQGYVFYNDADTGLTNPSANMVAFVTGSTEAMRINASQQVLINTTTDDYSAGAAKFYVKSSGGTMGVSTTTSGSVALGVWNQATTGDNKYIEFFVGAGTTTGNITYNRAGGLTAYNTTSDYRAKDVLGPYTDSGKLIDSIVVYNARMKGATLSRPMFVAHELSAPVPWAVTGEKDAVDKDGKPVYQQVDHSGLIPLLTAEIQSLRARMAAQEKRVLH